MSKKKHTPPCKPRRVTEFFSQPRMQGIQDGAAPLLPSPHAAHTVQNIHAEDTDAMDSLPPHPASPQQSPSGKRAALSPTLSPTKEPLHKKQHGDCQLQSITDSEQSNSLASLPVSDQLASESTLKMMLLSLQNDLRNELRASISAIHSRIDSVEERTTGLEGMVAEHHRVHQDFADAHDQHFEAIQSLQNKMADLEDRARRNNIKFRGIPEAIKPQELIPYLQRLFLILIPQLTQLDLTIDRAHRIAKPNHLSAEVPRDVLARIHFFQSKERVMAAARTISPLPDPYSSVTLYSDFSAATAQKRRKFQQVTTTLRNHHVQYRWGFPTKLIVTFQNQTTTFFTPKEGLKRLINWGLLNTTPPDLRGTHPRPRPPDPNHQAPIPPRR